jgi:hypothetical protein
MTPTERGPNRLNMKVTDRGRKVVIHLVHGLPPKISRDKKTITIISRSSEKRAVRTVSPNFHRRSKAMKTDGSLEYGSKLTIFLPG